MGGNAGSVSACPWFQFASLFNSAWVSGSVKFPSAELECAGATGTGVTGGSTCIRAGFPPPQFAWDCRRRRRPPSAPDLFVALPAPLFGFTSPSSRRPPPRRGRAATVPPTPRSKLPGAASRMRRLKPRRRLTGQPSSYLSSNQVKRDAGRSARVRRRIQASPSSALHATALQRRSRVSKKIHRASVWILLIEK